MLFDIVNMWVNEVLHIFVTIIFTLHLHSCKSKISSCAHFITIEGGSAFSFTGISVHTNIHHFTFQRTILRSVGVWCYQQDGGQEDRGHLGQAWRCAYILYAYVVVSIRTSLVRQTLQKIGRVWWPLYTRLVSSPRFMGRVVCALIMQ